MGRSGGDIKALEWIDTANLVGAECGISVGPRPFFWSVMPKALLIGELL